MTAYPPQPAWAPAPPPSRWSAGRVLALVFGILLVLPGLGLIGAGIALFAVDRTSDGYVMSDSESFSTSGFALTSERIDLSVGDWLPVSTTLGTARLDVTPTDPGSAVFVGIAPVADAAAYLDGVARTVVDDLGVGSGIGRRDIAGGPPAAAPGDQDFWVAQVSGAGTQQLTWEPARGNWVLVVMNADGSDGVSAEARIGATIPSLTGLAWGVLLAGVLLTLIAVLLLVVAFRRPRRPGPVPAGPPSAWAPPAPRPPSSAEQVSPEQARSTPPDPR